MSEYLHPSKLNKHLKIFLFIYFFTVLSGAVRKWVISDKQIGNIILLIQILVPFSFILIRGGLSNWRYGKSELSFIVFVLFIGIVNPLNLTFFHGILGFLLHFAFFFILFFYINNRQLFAFELIIQILIIAGLGQLILVFLQYTQPPDSIINTYADVEAVGSIALVGNSARVSGTFSYISGFTAFLFFNSLFIWTLIKYQYKSIYIITLLILGIFACFMSGSRGATYLYLIVIVLIAYSEYSTFSKVVFDFKLFFPILVFSTIILGIGNEKLFDTLNASITGFTERRNAGIESGEEKSRIINDFIEVINFNGNYPFFGVGIGSTYQGATKLFGISPYVQEYGFFESEIVRIVLEGGFLLLFTRIIILYFVLKNLFLPQIPKIILFIILLLFFPIIFNVYNSTFAALGIILVDHFYYIEYLNQRTSLSKVPKYSLGQFK